MSENRRHKALRPSLTAERLTRLREDRGWSMDDVASESRRISKPISTGTIDHAERGVYKPRFDTLEKFADIYGVSIDYLMGRTAVPWINEPWDGKTERRAMPAAEGLESDLQAELGDDRRSESAPSPARGSRQGRRPRR